jgi:hypothetical protein
MPLHATCFILVSCLAYFLTLKMEATYSTETSVDFQWTTQRYFAENNAMNAFNVNVTVMVTRI